MFKFFRSSLRHSASSAGFGSTNKSFTSLFFSSSRHPVLSSIFPFTPISRRSDRNCLLFPPVLSGYSGSRDTRFSLGTTRVARRGGCSCSLQSLEVSHLLFLTSTFLGLKAYCLIKILRHTGSLDFHRGACAPSSRSLCVLSFSLQRTQPSNKLFISLRLAESRTTRTPLISFCTV